MISQKSFFLRIFSTQELFCNFQRFDFWNFIAWLNPNTKKIFIKVKFLPRKQKLYDLELSNRISAFFECNINKNYDDDVL
jgi:hypothetical protein